MSKYKRIVEGMVTIGTTPEDAQLFARNARMAEDLLAGELAGSSATCYSSAWLRFREYCKGVGKEALPAEVDTVLTFLAMISKKGSVSAAKTACSSIAHFHRKQFPERPSPTESRKVKQVMMAIRRRFAKPVVKKEPVKAEVVKALFQHFIREAVVKGCSLKKLRFAVLYVLLYFSNARFEELANLRISNVSISEGGNLQLLFRKSKNNQFGNARKVMVASMVSKWCPVRLLVNYLGRLEGHPWGPEDFLFSSLLGSGRPRRGSQISYGSARSVLNSPLLMIGFDEAYAKKFRLHSFRDGVTSFAYSSGESTEEEIQFGGRWNSNETPKTYNMRAEAEMCKFSRVIAGGHF